MSNYGKALTWDDLADLYPGTARIMPMSVVRLWAENQKDTFYEHPEDGTIHLITKEEKK